VTGKLEEGCARCLLDITQGATPTIAAIAMHGINHPINDPTLVSYHRPELVALLPQLDQALDCWSLLNTGTLGAAKAKYLHKEPAEPAMAYKARLDRSTYTPIYRDSIRSYAGLLSRFQIIDAPPSMEQNDDNVDLQGSSMQSFLTAVDEMALRDGGAFVMVDMMPDNGTDNFFDQMNDGRHPYFISVKRCDVINWQVSYERGVESVNSVTVRQLRSVPDPEGPFGSKVEPVYFVLTPGNVKTYRLVKTDASRWSNVQIEDQSTSLPIVPLVWYGATTSRFAQGGLPMDGLADLSIQHYQMRSDLSELLHKCAMPVPVRKGAPIGPDGKPAPLILGPNTAVDLPSEGGDFMFAEPTGKSLERHQQEIKHIEELMDRSSLNFLYGANVKTATEASLRASQVASSVSALTRNKTAMFNTLMRLWAWYAGEQSSITSESGLAINDSLMSKPLEASEMAQLVNLFNNRLLSQRTVLEELQRGGVLDPDLVVADEIERIEEDRVEKMDQQVEEAEMKMDLEVERTEKMQELNPEPKAPVGGEQVPGKKRPKTEQEKAEQAAKVAK
jgi:hypothetical protein